MKQTTDVEAPDRRSKSSSKASRGINRAVSAIAFAFGADVS